MTEQRKHQLVRQKVREEVEYFRDLGPGAVSLATVYADATGPLGCDAWLNRAWRYVVVNLMIEKYEASHG